MEVRAQSAPPSSFISPGGGEPRKTHKHNELSPSEVTQNEGNSQESSIKDANDAPMLPEVNAAAATALIALDGDGGISSFIKLIEGGGTLLRMATLKEEITRLQAKLKSLTDEKLGKIEQNRLEKIRVDQENERRRKSSGGFLGFLKKIFKVVLAVFVAVTATVATVFTGGLAAPLLGFAMLSLASATADTLSFLDKARGGKGFDHIAQMLDPASMIGKGMGALAKKLGASDKQAAIVSSTFAAAATITVALASAACTAGLSGSATFQSVMDAISKFTTIGSTIVGVFESVAAIEEGLVDRDIAAIERDISKVQSQLKRLTALYLDTNRQLQKSMDELDKLMKRWQDLTSSVMQIVSDDSKIKSQINNGGVGAHPV